MSSKDGDRYIRPRTPGVFRAILFAIFLGLSFDASGQSAIDTLGPGKAVERDLTKGETHSYRTRLDAGEYLRAVVNQEGIAVAVRIYGADGRNLAEGSGTFNGEWRIFFVSEVSGEYRLEVRVANENAEAHGHYEIKIAELRPATDE